MMQNWENKALLPDASFHSIRVQDGKQMARTNSAKDFLKDLKKGKQKWVERIWDPVVTIQGEVAAVQAPYDFHSNGQFSHCGKEVFNLLKTADGWKISSITYDVQTEGCDPSPLGPVKE